MSGKIFAVNLNSRLKNIKMMTKAVKKAKNALIFVVKTSFLSSFLCHRYKRGSQNTKAKMIKKREKMI